MPIPTFRGPDLPVGVTELPNFSNHANVFGDFAWAWQDTVFTET
jgi:hypothetical protein